VRNEPLRIPATPTSVSLEILYCALVLFSGGARLEGTEVAALASFRISFSGIKAV
jgi:hypothetical protein